MNTNWLLTREGPNRNGHTESLYCLGNSRLGFRGFPLWRDPLFQGGVFLNGLYDTRPIRYEEDVYGSAKIAQHIVPLPDGRFIAIRINDEPIRPIKERKTLDFKTGILTHHVETKEAVIEYETFLSMTRTSLGAVTLNIKQTQNNKISILSGIAHDEVSTSNTFDPRVANHIPKLRTITASHTDDGFTAEFETENSNLAVHMTTSHRCEIQPKETTYNNLPALLYETTKKSINLTKFFSYETERKPLSHPSYETLKEEQVAYYERFWQKSDVRIQDDPTLQLALRFNIFQLNQSTGHALAAKGLTGVGYEGHSFWDTEIYALPFFTHTNPEKARDLLLYRIGILPYAKKRARELSQKGALFPWRTIYGPEASAYFPAGTAQYHINADIAYALYQYLDITQDHSILDEGGLELLIETARFYLDLGSFNEQGEFVINEVTGPDEYTALVDNNAYTNMMVRHHLRRLKEFIDESSLTHEELDTLNRAIETIVIPFDKEKGITLQDDSFLSKEIWDETKKGPLKRPMLLHYHPLVIYRHRLIKQADTVLAHVLLSDETPWYQKRRDMLFYEPLTTGDSSLSAGIQGILAFEIGEIPLAVTYLEDTTLTDIRDLHSNTKDGLHTAAMAASWMGIVYGVAGYRYLKNTPTFRPRLPEGWAGVGFSLTFGDVTLTIRIDKEETTYQATGPITIAHRSTKLNVTDTPITIKTKPTCKAVIFDLDGVITSTDDDHYRAWKAIADKNGLAFDRTINQELRGVSRTESLKIILKHNNRTLADEEIKKLCDEKNEIYRSFLTELTPKDILPNIEALLKQLKEKNMRIGLASASRNARTILSNLKLTHYFDVIVDAKDLIRPKPDPEIFARAADALGFYPEECTGVEDAKAGIEAINAAMMKAVGIGDAVDPDECDVHRKDTGLLTIEDLLF